MHCYCQSVLLSCTYLTEGSHFFAGLPTTEEKLREVAEQSGVLNVPDDFLQPDLRAKCQR